MKVVKGLRDVYVAESRICRIDPEEGKIYIYGYDMDELAVKSNFEEVSYLLLYGYLPTKREYHEFLSKIKGSMSLPEPVIEFIRRVPQNIDMMERLRTIVSYIGNLRERELVRDEEGIREYAIDLISKMPSIISYTYRFERGLEPIEPRDDLSLAGNLLYMVKGEDPDPRDVRGLDISLILYSEHGMNASTFASIVVASTGSDYYSSILAGIGALRGPLHGYANTDALKQFIEIGDPDRVDEWFRENIESRARRLIGFGHRLYRIHDPRAKHYQKWLEENGNRFSGEARKVYEIAIRLYRRALNSFLADKGIYPNCDYWSGLMYYSMGLPIEIYTPIFLLSRLTGWTAHIIEYIENNVLIRPRALYIGPEPREYIPIDMRQGDTS